MCMGGGSAEWACVGVGCMHMGGGSVRVGLCGCGFDASRSGYTS